MTAVALVTDQRRTRFKQVVCRGAVWHVAVATVVGNRLVVMHEGAALFHVAGVAGFDNAIAFHEFWPCRAM